MKHLCEIFKKVCKFKAFPVALLFIISFSIGMLFNANVNAGQSSSVLPISKGGTGNILGNVESVEKLQTPRMISGVPFDGSQDILVPGLSKIIPLEAEDEMPIYIKFSDAATSDYASTIVDIAGAACTWNPFVIHIEKKENYGTYVKNVYHNNDATTQCLSYVNGLLGSRYILKMESVTVPRNFYWTANKTGVTASKVTDPAERATLANATWYQFNFIPAPLVPDE